MALRRVVSLAVLENGGEGVLSHLGAAKVFRDELGVWQKAQTDEALVDLLTHRVERADFWRQTTDLCLEPLAERLRGIGIEHDNSNLVGQMNL